MKFAPLLLSALLLCGVWATGCGQKGPLYLPEQDNSSREAPADESTSDN